MSNSNKALLVILDGYGIAENPEVSAIERAKTPFFDSLVAEWPNAKLSASGQDVGLPEGQFGNSEVGHLNIGAGRIVWQELTRVNKSIKEKDFFKNPVLTEAYKLAKEKGKIHVMGLFSDGGVHSHNNQMYALLEMAKQFEVENVFVHAFTDGRDTSPNGGLRYCREFSETAEKIGKGTIASVIGRYFAMDRDHRWERTEKAYNLLVHGEGKTVDNPEKAFEQSYSAGTTDEFIEPHIVKTDQNSRIEPGDVVVFYNIRGDRARQITKALNGSDEVPFAKEELNLFYATFTSYDDTFNEFAHVAFPPLRLKNTLGEFVSKNNLKQLRIAETEKYPHVTYFFNGGDETPNKGEERILIPSPKVPTYDLQPEMSAEELTDKLNEQLQTGKFDLAVINYANPDMVGHTGSMEAAVKAVEFVDKQLERVVKTAQSEGYDIVIISDHGNADCMIQDDGSAHTAHTTAKVPVIILKDEEKNLQVKNGILADVAPTLLKLLGLEQPEEMSGTPLF